MSKKLIAFSYYGGKNSHLDWLLDKLPHTKSYCEPFCGSCAVLLNKKPSLIETINDKDKNIVTFFKVLRDNSEELIEKLLLTPYSRAEYIEAKRKIRTNDFKEGDDIERARCFFVVVSQSVHSKCKGGWSYNIEIHHRKPILFTKKVLSLEYIVERLKMVQIECLDAIECIKKYDSNHTLFYCDPPYPVEAREDNDVYMFEMTDDEHIKLAETLHNVKGLVAISGYDCELYRELYKDWNLYKAKEKVIYSATGLNKTSTKKQECLWTNYDLSTCNNNLLKIE